MRRALEITTNVGCKNLCEYCPQDVNIDGYKLRSRDRMMSIETFRNALQKVPRDLVIYFAGSAEPFLNPQGIDFVELACKRGHVVHVYTTLVGLTREHIDRLSVLPIYRYVIHLPSSEYKENYSATPEYLDLLQHFDATIFAGYLSGQIPPQPNDGASGPDRRPVEYMSIGRVAPAVRTVLEPSRPIAEAVFPGSDFGGNVKASFAPHRVWSGPLTCTQNRLYWNVLYPNGDVSLCCEDFGLKHIIGNLLTDSYNDLHRSAEFKRVLRGMADESKESICRVCEYARPVQHVPIHERVVAKLRGIADFGRTPA